MLEFGLRKPAHLAAGANHKRATAELGEPPRSDGWKRPLGSLRAYRGCGTDASRSGCYGNSER